MKAAFLIRCSTKKQDYDRQVKDLARLAKRFGYEYEDSLIFGEHITGKDDATKRDRLSIQHLKEAAINSKFDVVLVSETSRMSRDPMSGRYYVRQLINMDIPVYFRDIDKWTIEPDTGKKVNDAETVIGGAFDAAWKYLKSMKTQIASGRRDELDNNCISIGQPFFGYKRFGGKDKSKKNSWIIDEDAKEVVLEVYKRYCLDGATLKTVALSITKDYGEKFGKKFSIGTINHILTFEPYATGIKVVSLKDPDTEEVDQFNVEIPTIISKNVFDKATTKRKTNRCATSPYPKQTVYTLSKLLKCNICGHSLTPRKRAGDNGGKYRMINGHIGISWYCMAGINNQTDCNSRMSINNDKIEPIIWELVKKELIGYANLNTDERMSKLEEIKSQIANVDADISNFLEQISTMEKQIERAYNAYIEAPEAIVDAAKSRYLKTLEKCQKEKDECESKIDGLKEKKDRLNYYKTALEQPQVPADAIAKAESDPVEKRRLVTELIDKIIPYKISTYKVNQRDIKELKTLKQGVILLEVYSISGIYNILFDANQRSIEQTAYYISGNFVTFQNGINKYDAYSTGEYFVIPNASMVMETEKLVEFANMNQFVDIAATNGWELTFRYEY